MRKRELTPIELENVVRLRQLGAKWTEVERESKVERRAAKRAYEQWEEDRKAKEQEAWRFRVAALAFDEHLETLVKLAESLIDGLRGPETLAGLDSANKALDRLWMKDTEGQAEASPASGVQIERIVWRNKRLLECLQQHTREKIRWEALEQWKLSRNNALEYAKVLRSKAAEIIKLDLRERSGLENRIKGAVGSDDVIARMADGIVGNIWRATLTEKPDQIHVVKGVSLFTEGQVWLEFHEGDSETKLYLNELNLAREVRDLCRRLARTLQEEVMISLPNTTECNPVQELSAEVREMRSRVKELEESLDRLTLRPILLWTRCDLCPL